MLSDLLPFVAASLVVVVVPGPDMTLILRNGALGGTRAAAATVVGVLLGNVLLATLAVLGLSGVVRASHSAYLIIKIVGAMYLMWLGLNALRSWWELRTDASAEVASGRRDTRRPAGARALRQGFLSVVLNPKVTMFYLALLPQFQLDRLTSTESSLVLASTYLAMDAAWFVLLLVCMRAIERTLARRRARRAIAGASGVALTGLGLSLLRG